MQEFFLFSRLAPEASESIGRYTFGELIPLSRNLAEDALNREVVDQVTARTILLHRIRWRCGRMSWASTKCPWSLLDIESDLGLRDRQRVTDYQIRTVSGLNTLYFFLGREALFLAITKKRRSRRKHWRSTNAIFASIVLGGALMGQAETLDPVKRCRRACLMRRNRLPCGAR